MRGGADPIRDHEALLATATSAVADVARSIVAQRRASRGALELERKGEGDFVTALDHRAERELRARLLGAFPDHGFLGEETGCTRGRSEPVWVVDPIDGTSNFAQGLPAFAVSVACVVGGMPEVAAVHVFPEGATYSAVRGRGAWRDGERLVTPAATLSDASIVGVQWFRGEFDAAFLRPLLLCGARIRVLGSTVVQLCDVAAGRLHANAQLQGRVWDIAACGLIAMEAGARVTDLSGRARFPFADLSAERHHPTLVAPMPLHAELVALLADYAAASG